LKFQNKKLLIFDLDGTLINSAPDLAVAVNYMLEQLEKEIYTEETIHEWVGNGALMLVQRALSGERTINDTLDEAYVQNALKIFLDFYAQNLCNATTPYPNVVSTLRTLKERSYTLSIVTNKPFDFVQPIIDGLEMGDLFEVILGGDSLATKKPDPAPLLHVSKTLDTSISSCVMVGDSRNDIQAANGCDMDSVGVTYGYNYGEDISIYQPSLIIDDFSELLKAL